MEKASERTERMSDRMQELIRQLNDWDYHYYTLDEPIVSDKEYDSAYDELVQLEKKTGKILPDSPTQRVGGAVLDAFVKHTHLAPLYSLGKARTEEEVQAWVERAERGVQAYNRMHPESKLPALQFCIELKFDGLTINLTYDEGRLLMAATRGNGVIGEEVLAQIRTVSSIPLSIPYQGKIEVQGEGIMPLSTLRTYNETAPIPLKNARNAAAGAIRNLDPNVTAQRHLDVFLYQVGYREESLFETELDMMRFLRDNHFKVHPFLRTASDIEGILQGIREVDAVRHQLDVLTDGVVIKINDLRTREALGFTAKFPRWALAYKFEAEEASTILENVEWNVGRTGKITPTALLSPVDIGGVTVSRATLNNYDDIVRKQVQIGGRVLIRRSNEVIPEILGAIEDPSLRTVKIEKPTHCPSCGSELVYGNVHIYCPNSLSCMPQLLQRLVHFSSRNAMNIDGLSEKTLARLMANGLREMADLYHLQAEDLLSIEGFQEKRTARLLEAIAKSKQTTLARFLFAIGIPEVGETAARDLAAHFRDFDTVRNATQEELEQLEDFGPVTAGNIVEFFHDEHIQGALEHLLSVGIVMENAEGPSAGSLSGKKIVVTGTIEGYSRNVLEEAIRSQGGKAQGSVSSKTDLVLAGEAAGSKRTRAIELGIPVLEGDALYEFLQEHFS
ncbi:NAD-dependent DNA ligase LigA [Peptoniphilaceae bacterium SGI.137]|nr:NAD-dependent DNA ligase LigA [Peptoniphilaceae bacterium]